MAAKIPEQYLDLLEGPVVVTFVTILPDGHPQATPVWCKWDGEHILINTAIGRKKDQNVRDNPKVTVVAIDPKNPYRYLEVRGVVKELTTDGAEALIDELAMLYVGKAKYYGEVAPADAREERITIVIEPQHTNAMG